MKAFGIHVKYFESSRFLNLFQIFEFRNLVKNFINNLITGENFKDIFDWIMQAFGFQDSNNYYIMLEIFESLKEL